MNTLRTAWKKSLDDQKGTAIVIALFVLTLIGAFVALAMSRTASEATSVGNEAAETRTFYAAQGSLETMTRNFNKIFEIRINATPTDIDNVEGDLVNGDNVPGLSQQLGGRFTFNQQIDPTTPGETVVLPGGDFAGLIARRDIYRLQTTATDLNTGTQVELTRNILNNRIPLFQFGIFYDDDLELFRPPRFSFGGRVHSNGNFFVSPGTEGVYFDSRVTANGHIVTQSWRNWYTGDSGNNETWIKNASGVFQRLAPNRGSVLNTTAGAANNVFEFPPAIPAPSPTPNADLPPSRLNPTWAADSAIFDGNLRARVPRLNLPLNIGGGTPLTEMVKRGKEVASAAGGDLFMNNAGATVPVTAADADNPVLRRERFANKTGIRVSLADSKAKLPGCASGVLDAPVATPCGVRLDGDPTGQNAGAIPSPRGYQPKSMRSAVGGAFNYTATRVNGDRLSNAGREVWIKVETVRTDPTTLAVLTTDITEDILSLGVTEEIPASITVTAPANYVGTRSDNGSVTLPSANLTATTPQTGASVSSYPDSRSIVKMQTFTIPGAAIPGGGNFLYSYGAGAAAMNVVRRFSNAVGANFAAGCTAGCTTRNVSPNAGSENLAHLKQATVNGTANEAIVPFPIEMFDTREGTYFDDSTRYAAGQVTRNGVMSMVEIDVANLRRFLRGDFNGLFPDESLPALNNTPFSRNNGDVGLRGCTYQTPAPTPCDIPENDGGWVLYLSDRRGDSDFDGRYAMEDVYSNAPGNTGGLDPGEDLDPAGTPGFGLLLAKYIDPASAFNGCLGIVPNCEATRYADTYMPDRAAVSDHPYYRRGIRLKNGTTVPGIYNAAAPSTSKGFTVASENGIYVKGNYNATGAAAPPTSGNTPYDQYFPFDTATHIPASIVADSVTILSNGWNDAQSFISPYNRANRPAAATQMRFAMISGDTLSTRQNAVNQGSSVNGQNENGGVHNFKRFLEIWSGVRFDYAGSLINLFNSQNNNGSFKCCNTVYNPPIRNWVFDSTFLDPARLPPGTPYFQFSQTTGFQRTNN